MAAAEPKQATKDFKVSFFADEVYVLSLLGVWFLIFAVCLIGFWGFGWTYRHTTLGLVIGLFSAVLGFVSVQMLAYILVLCFRAGVIFSLDRRGLRDYASFSQVGYILLKDIRKVVIKGTVLGDFVLVYLRPDSKGMKKKTLFQKALSWWVAWISPDAIVIPMGVIDVSRLNLQTQFSHFSTILREYAHKQKAVPSTVLDLKNSRFESPPLHPAGSKSPPKADQQPIVDNREDYSSRLKVGSFEDPAVKPVTITGSHSSPNIGEHTSVTELTMITDEGDEMAEGTFVPPLENQTPSEKSQVVQRVNALREYVTSMQIDRKLCDIYADYIANFPRWNGNQDPRIPATIFNIRSLASTAGYEEVGFQYQGKQIHFSLRRDLGPADLALLTLSQDNNVKVSLRVSVEIGSLEPDRIEVYHRGSWEDVFLEMYSELSGESSQGSTEITELVTQATDIDIEVLKQNFGIQLDGDED